MKKLALRLIIIVALSLNVFIGFNISATPVAAADSLTGWANRVTLTIDHTKIYSQLTNFPMLIHLSSSSGIGATNMSMIFTNLGSNSNKLAVTTSDGVTQCSVEMARWDLANKQAWLWVKVPVVSSTADTILYLYYDNTHSDNTTYVGDVGSTPGKAVWSNGYVCVLHFTEQGNGTIDEYKDSTGRGNNGKGHTTGVPTREANSKFGYGQHFDGKTDKIVIDDSNDLSQVTTGYLSMSLWLNYDTLNIPYENTEHNYARILTKAEDLSNLEYHLRIYASYINPGQTTFYVMKPYGTFGSGADLNLPGLFSAGKWNFVTCTMDNKSYTQGYPNLIAYHDEPVAAEYIPTPSPGGYKTRIVSYNNVDNNYDVYPQINGTSPLVLGGGKVTGTENAYDYLDGSMAEFRVSNVKRSASWVGADYHSQNDTLVRYGISSSTSTTSSSTSTNAAPVLNAIGSKSVNEGATLAFTMSATDANGDTLTYAASNLPSGATFNTATRTFSWTPTYFQYGTYSNIRFSVSDGKVSDYEDITITVSNVNRAPVLDPIGNKSVNEGATLTFTVSAADPDRNTITYSATNLPAGATFNAATRTFSWTSTSVQAGVYAIVFVAADFSLSDSENITITVNDLSVTNAAPVLNAIGSKSVNEGATLAFTVSATDANGDTLTYAASNLPSGATFNTATRTFSWTPTYFQYGTYSNIRFSVSDGKVSDYEDITITVSNVNRAPVLDPIGNKSVNEGATLTFTVSAADPDRNTITYSATNLPAGATFNAATRTFSWTSTSVQAGVYAIVFVAADFSLSDSENITITVNDLSVTNAAPVLNAIGSKSVNEGATLAFTVSATDANGDTLTYAASNLPSGATFNTATRTFSWTPTYFQYGTYSNIRFSVSDGKVSDYEDITITVSNVNRAPVLDPIGNKSVNEGATLTFTVSAADPDRNTITYSATNLPAGATFNAATRTFSWTPTSVQAGVYAIVFVAADFSLSDSENITITVNNTQ